MAFVYNITFHKCIILWHKHWLNCCYRVITELHFNVTNHIILRVAKCRKHWQIDINRIYVQTLSDQSNDSVSSVRNYSILIYKLLLTWLKFCIPFYNKNCFINYYKMHNIAYSSTKSVYFIIITLLKSSKTSQTRVIFN